MVRDCSLISESSPFSCCNRAASSTADFSGADFFELTALAVDVDGVLPVASDLSAPSAFCSGFAGFSDFFCGAGFAGAGAGSSAGAVVVSLRVGSLPESARRPILSSIACCTDCVFSCLRFSSSSAAWMSSMVSMRRFRSTARLPTARSISSSCSTLACNCTVMKLKVPAVPTNTAAARARTTLACILVFLAPSMSFSAALLTCVPVVATADAERLATSAASNTIPISDSSCCDAERLFSTKICTASSARLAVSCGTATVPSGRMVSPPMAAAASAAAASSSLNAGGGGAGVKPSPLGAEAACSSLASSLIVLSVSQVS